MSVHRDALFRFQSGVLIARVGSCGERAHSGPWSRSSVGGGWNGRDEHDPTLDAYIVPSLYGHGLEAVRLVGCDVEAFQ